MTQESQPLKIFIMIFNNGESYEDYHEWNQGMYTSLESALLIFETVNKPAGMFDFTIEEWYLDGQRIKLHEYEIKNGQAIKTH